MTTFQESLRVLQELFKRDYQFALSTCQNNMPLMCFVDTYYGDTALKS